MAVPHNIGIVDTPVGSARGSARRLSCGTRQAKDAQSKDGFDSPWSNPQGHPPRRI
jgi:hypothetical protein